MNRFLFLLPLALVGCSLIVNSSLDLLLCDVEGKCQAGYSCRADKCVKDESVNESEECSDSIQCAKPLFCPPTLALSASPQCSRPCTKIYARDSECGAQAVCVPVPDRTNPGKFTGGACVPMECPSGDTREADKICQNLEGDWLFAAPSRANSCIRLAEGGGLCLPRCQVGIRAANNPRGTDSCVSDSRGNPTHCGRVATGDFICLPAGNLLEGQQCSLFPSAMSPPPDTCGLNIMGTTAGLPLVCLDRSGAVSGNLRCRIAACERNEQCPAGQLCVTENGLAFCRNPSEI